jgi:hypothetical protein
MRNAFTRAHQNRFRAHEASTRASAAAAAQYATPTLAGGQSARRLQAVRHEQPAGRMPAGVASRASQRQNAHVCAGRRQPVVKRGNASHRLNAGMRAGMVALRSGSNTHALAACCSRRIAAIGDRVQMLMRSSFAHALWNPLNAAKTSQSARAPCFSVTSLPSTPAPSHSRYASCPNDYLCSGRLLTLAHAAPQLLGGSQYAGNKVIHADVSQI